MHTLFPPGMGRLGTILALGLALWAAAGAGRAIADDPPGCGDRGCGCNPVFWQGYEPLPATLGMSAATGLPCSDYFAGWDPSPRRVRVRPGRSP